MLLNLLYGLPVMGACLFLQSLLVVKALRYYANRQPAEEGESFWSTMIVINGVMLILVAGNIAQIVLWAILFKYLGEFDLISDAIFHSAVNFTTLGYGDIIMSEKHRLLGPFEGINGVLMIGVSTAVLMASLQDALNKTLLAKGKKRL